KYLTIACVMMIPLLFIMTGRFLMLCPTAKRPNFSQALKINLSATFLNLFLPAKSGDVFKASVLSLNGNARLGVGLSLILYERICDLFALGFWCMVSWSMGWFHFDTSA